MRLFQILILQIATLLVKGGNDYFVIGGNFTWLEAKMKCNQHGATMASINGNVQEGHAIEAALITNGLEFWTAGNNTSGDGCGLKMKVSISSGTTISMDDCFNLYPALCKRLPNCDDLDENRVANYENEAISIKGPCFDDDPKSYLECLVIHTLSQYTVTKVRGSFSHREDGVSAQCPLPSLPTYGGFSVWLTQIYDNGSIQLYTPTSFDIRPPNYREICEISNDLFYQNPELYLLDGNRTKVDIECIIQTIPLTGLPIDFHKVVKKMAIDGNSMAVEYFSSLDPSSLSVTDCPSQRNLLHYAAVNGDVATGMVLLRKNRPLIEARDHSNRTALHEAARNNHRDFVNTLLDYGADLEALDSRNRTAVYYASYRNLEQIVEILLKRGADPNAKRDSGFTPLLTAVWGGKTKVVQHLLEHGANLEAETNIGETAIWIASRFDKIEIIEMLLSGKYGQVNIEKIDHFGRTPLQVSALSDSSQATELLLANGANVNSVDFSGRTPLHDAALYNSINVATVLMDNGAEINAKNYQGRTPLHEAVSGNSDGIARLLLESGAMVNYVDLYGKTPLHVAGSSGNLVLAKILIDYGATIDMDNTEVPNWPESLQNLLSQSQPGRCTADL